MLYYFVPDTTASGEIKIAYQLVDALNALGAPAVIASPEGRAATCFSSRAAVVDSARVHESFRPEDIAVFFEPQDYHTLRGFRGRLVYHCQETGPAIDPILADPGVRVLTSGRQASEYAHAHGVQNPLEIGFSIAPCFAYAGEPKFEQAAACMPRRGTELFAAVKRKHGALRYFAIDNLHESGAARLLKRCAIFVATHENEWCELTALEAMSAGCVVVSPPLSGGTEYLEDGGNCRIAAPRDFVSAIGELLQERSAGLRFRLRQAAVATARRCTTALMQQRLSKLLDGPLSDWRRRP